MKIEESFGVIPLKKRNKEWYVFLVHHQKGFWAFPKGHAELQETSQEAAARELKEETNLEIVDWLDFPPFVEKYWFTHQGEKVSKTVTYFGALVKGKVIIQLEELAGGQWIKLEKASLLITYPESREVCKQLISFLSSIH